MWHILLFFGLLLIGVKTYEIDKLNLDEIEIDKDTNFGPIDKQTLEGLQQLVQLDGQNGQETATGTEVKSEPSRRSQIKVFDLTKKVNEVVNNVKLKIQNDYESKRLTPTSPSLTINQLPLTIIQLDATAIEGVRSIRTHKDRKSVGIYYNKLYAFTFHRYDKLTFYYNMKITFFGLFTLKKDIIIQLTDAPAKLNLVIENDKSVALSSFEFINPKLQIRFKGNFLIQMLINYIINNSHPVVKQKIVEIVSRDMKYVVKEHLDDVQ